MCNQYNRRTALKVRDGQVQKKNRHIPTGHLGCVIDRESPGRGYRHVVCKRDLQDFIDIIPKWPALSERLERIVLVPAGDADGCHEFFHREETGAIYLHAWHEDLWVTWDNGYFDTHSEIFLRLGVSHDRHKDKVDCRFTDAQARAYMLLHVFMHELGHHWDRITQKHLNSKRGEDFAERFANRHFDLLYPDYVRVFGDPARNC